MAYARMGEDSDVYAYHTVNGYVTHVSNETFFDETLNDFYYRLFYLIGVGYKVPQSTLNRVEREIYESGVLD